MYETFEHTADLGLRIRAGDLSGLFAEAGRALFAVLVDNLDEVRPVEEISLEIDGRETEYLFFDWLNELLFRFEGGGMLLSQFEVTMTGQGLHATARGEKIDPARHQLAHEVKAITYHELKVEQTPEGWLAEVIVDI